MLAQPYNHVNLEYVWTLLGAATTTNKGYTPSLSVAYFKMVFIKQVHVNPLRKIKTSLPKDNFKNDR